MVHPIPLRFCLHSYSLPRSPYSAYSSLGLHGYSIPIQPAPFAISWAVALGTLVAYYKPTTGTLLPFACLVPIFPSFAYSANMSKSYFPIAYSTGYLQVVLSLVLRSYQSFRGRLSFVLSTPHISQHTLARSTTCKDRWHDVEKWTRTLYIEYVCNNQANRELWIKQGAARAHWKQPKKQKAEGAQKRNAPATLGVYTHVRQRLLRWKIESSSRTREA